MLLRISLGIAILAGLAALYFSQVNVKQRINTLTSDLAIAQDAQQKAQAAQKKAEGDSKKAQAERDAAKGELAKTTDDLKTTQTRLKEQQTRADQRTADLTKMTAERNEAQQDLSAWKALQITPDQVNNLKNQLAKTTTERDVMIEENKILDGKNRKLFAQIEKLLGGEERDPEMPATAKGKILAYDPKFGFAVVDVGGTKGAVERGKLLVSREGKLVGVLRLSRVEANQSVANLIPELTQVEMMEGDVVIPR